MEENQPADNPYLSNNLLSDSHQNSQIPLEYAENFLPFLKEEEEENPQSTPSFFSENGLSRDIRKVTEAEVDSVLEGLHVLDNIFRPQLENLNERKKLRGEENKLITSLQDAWKNFLGNSISKGILYPPEKLLEKKSAQEVQEDLSKEGGEVEVFQDLDRVVDFIKQLKQKILDFPSQLIQKEEILASLDHIEGFYINFKERVIDLAQKSLQKNDDSMTNYHALENLLQPKAVMMSDIFPNRWAYRIPRKKAQKMLSLSRDGLPVQNYSSEHSMHRVSALPEKNEAPEPLVYFKANGDKDTPIQPEKEFMLFSLYRYLKIPVPETALLILTNVFSENSNYFYAVQASEAVSGSSALEASQNAETEFEEKAYASQVIGALLTNPSDGSFKNYKYSPQYKTLVGIDNDLIFKSEFTGDNGRTVNVKSVLYLSPLMDKPVPSSVKTYLTTIDPHLMILLWLHDLDRKNRGYKDLFSKLSYQNTRCIYQNLRPRNEQPSLAACLKEKISIDSELHQSSFYPQILISKDLLNSLAENLQKIKATFIQNPSASSQNIFEEISSILGKYYHKLRLKIQDPQTLQVALWGGNINGVNYAGLKFLFKSEELRSLPHNKNLLENEVSLYEPREFFGDCKRALISDQSPLDDLIKRHKQRKEENVLDLQFVRKELKLLIQEGFTHLKSPREAIDFLSDISKAPNNISLVQEIRSLISCLQSAKLKWLFTVEKYFLRADTRVPNELRASSLPVIGVGMKQRIFILTESEKRYLFDQQGNIKKNAPLAGRSHVTYFPEKNQEFYLKQDPEFPGFEYASIKLMRLLGIKHLPYHDLVVINKSPVLVSQNVKGSPVHEVWDDPRAFYNLDPFQTGLLIISAMLINPEDGKEDNYILSPDRRFLIPIDNDHCFLPSYIQKGGNFWNAFTIITTLQTKTLLFCLDEMTKPIPLEVKQHILSLDFDFLFTKWMSALEKLEDKLNNFIYQGERNKSSEQKTVMEIPFCKQFIHNLHQKAHKIQDILKKTFQSTPFHLLKAIEPFVAKCYQESFSQGHNLQTRFRAATDNLYQKTSVDGSRFSIQDTRTMMEILHISKRDLHKDAAFQSLRPVDASKLLKRLSEERMKTAEREQEILYELDAKNEETKWISLFGKSPIEIDLNAFFTNPKEALVLKGSKRIVSSKLMKYFALTPNRGSKIRFLSLPESPSLAYQEIRILAEGCPNLEYLNVSGCAELKQIRTAEGEWPLLTRLEAKECLNLKKFVSFSPLKILRIETKNGIEIFVERSTLDIFILALTDRLQFSLKKQERFELKSRSQFLSDSNLVQCAFSGVNIQRDFQNLKITLGVCTISSEWHLTVFITVINLQGFNLGAENIQTLSRLNLINLKRLELSQTGITRADGLPHLIKGDWPKLNYLDLSGNRIDDKGLTILSQGKWPQLESLLLEEIDITKRGFIHFLLNIHWANCREIISSFFPKDLPQLEELDLSSSNIDKSDIEVIVSRPKWPQLKHINLSKNNICDQGLEVLCLGNWPSLQILDLSSTSMTQFGIELLVQKSKWRQLKHLNLSSNKIDDKALETLSQRDWPELETIILESISITKRGLFNFLLSLNWPNCKEIIVDQDLKSFTRNLFPNNYPLLEELDLSSSNIDKSDIEVFASQLKWPRLKSLNLSYNYEINEGLTILSRGNLPRLETLILEGTDVTKRGLLNFLLNLNWPNFQEIITTPYLKNFAQSFFPNKWFQLEELDLSSSNIDKSDIEIIVSRPKWPQLKHINLSKNNICDQGLEILCLGNWPFLEILNLECAEITSVGIEVLAQKSKWPLLKHLNLSYNQIDLKGLEILCQGNWPFLEILNLECAGITLVGIEILVQGWPQLKHLNLSNNEINDQGLEILCQGDWPFLQGLDLAKNRLTPNEIKIIISKNKWSQLKKLNLSYNSEICDQGLAILCEGNWPFLEILDLEGTEITSEGIDRLVQTSKWPQLKHLNLSRNPIECQGFEILCQGDWPLLEALDLTSTKMTPAGIEVFVQQSKWPNFKHLNFNENDKINDEALESLSQGNWPLLETLGLDKTNVTKKGLLNLIWKLNWLNLTTINFNPDQKNFPASLLLPKNWSFLEKLDLSSYQITQNEIEIIVKIYNWPHLKHLDLSYNKIENQGLQILAQGNWPSLESLNLQHTEVTVKEIKEIVNVSNWPHLKHLNLAYNQLDDEALALLFRGNWPLLETLDCRYIDVTNETLLLSICLLNTNWFNFKSIIGYCETQNSFKKNLIENFIRKDLSKLERLDLNDLKITLAELEPIIKKNNFKFPQLKFLKISENDPSWEEKISVLVLTECPLLKELHIENLKLSFKSLEIIRNQSKWLRLVKHLNVSNSGIFDEGLSVLAHSELPVLEELSLKNTKITSKGIETFVKKVHLPNLEKLDISENTIFDEGLKMLTSGDWPLFQHLVYYDTKVTSKGHIVLLENFKWPNFSKLEHSLSESFYNRDKKLSEIIASIVPVPYDGSNHIVAVLKTNWLNSKVIYLSISRDGFSKAITLLPLEKFDQFEEIQLSFNDEQEIEQTQSIVFPRNLKRIDLSHSSLSDAKRLGSLCFESCPLLEDLSLQEAQITAKGIETLMSKSDLLHLKELDVSLNPIQNIGLEMLASSSWNLLEFINLEETGITDDGIQILGKKSNWSNLKELHLSRNQIQNEGLKALSFGKWPRLENLYLRELNVTETGIASMARFSKWPNLKILDLSENEKIFDENLGSLGSGKWPLLECLNLNKAGIKFETLEILVWESSWPGLKNIHLCSDLFPKDEGDHHFKARGIIQAQWPTIKLIIDSDDSDSDSDGDSEGGDDDDPWIFGAFDAFDQVPQKREKFI